MPESGAESGDTIEGSVEKIAYGGSGLTKHNSLVIFTPFTAPGDTARIKITRKKKSYAEGELLSVLSPSPHRTKPPCPYYEKCGGCQLQHITYQEQTTQKKQMVFETLSRFLPSLLPLDYHTSEKHWAYRAHIRLNLKPQSQGFEPGFIHRDNHSLIPVTTCPIFISKDDTLLLEVRSLLTTLSNKQIKNASCRLFHAPHNQYIIALSFLPRFPQNHKSAITAFLKDHPRCLGITLRAPGKDASYGKPDLTYSINNLFITTSPYGFMQANLPVAYHLYSHLASLIPPSSSIIDAYCGAGALSCQLASLGHTVIGIESNPSSIKSARRNATTNNLQLNFLLGKTESLLNHHLPADIVILNPPRTGLDPSVIKTLLKTPPKHIFYISCNPPTLGRDLAHLTSDTYNLKQLDLFDMFPQTYHIETLAKLTLKTS